MRPPNSRVGPAAARRATESGLARFGPRAYRQGPWCPQPAAAWIVGALLKGCQLTTSKRGSRVYRRGNGCLGSAIPIRRLKRPLRTQKRMDGASGPAMPARTLGAECTAPTTIRTADAASSASPAYGALPRVLRTTPGNSDASWTTAPFATRLTTRVSVRRTRWRSTTSP